VTLKTPILIGSLWAILFLSIPYQGWTKRLIPTSFANIPHWDSDDHAKALGALRASCATRNLPRLGGKERWASMCKHALTIEPNQARYFFEEYFTPMRVDGTGKLTGYYEATLRVSKNRHGAYQYPIYGVPKDLVTKNRQWFQQRQDGSLRPYPSRGDIMQQGVNAPVLYWANDQVDVFFTHVQGSATVILDTGGERRISFANRNGREYVAIGKVLKDRGYLPPNNVTMQTIRAWFAQNPTKIEEILAQNPSYIFFKDEPVRHVVGASNVSLTPMRSIAVDKNIWPFGLPIWIDVRQSNTWPTSFARLVIAQDTGAAIVGESRGDLFTGSNPAAVDFAGRLNNPVVFTVLVPK
jgi:membrane-bound lytic murein transglycosylase A